MGGKKSTQKTSSSMSQNTTNSPYAPASAGLSQLANNIQSAMSQSMAQPTYGGDFVAQAGNLQQAVIPALQQVAGQANGYIPLLEQAAATALGNLPTFDGPSLAAGTQSFSAQPGGIEGAVTSAINPYVRQLTEQILPGLQSAGIESGAYGGTRAQQTLPGQALRDTGRMVSEIAGGIALQDFQNTQARNLQAYGLSTDRNLGAGDLLTQRLSMYPELLNSAMNMGVGAADMTNQAASYDLAMRQAEINNALARDDYNVNAPYRSLFPAAQLYNTFAPYASQATSGKSKSTTTTKESGGLAGQLLQGALGVGSMIAGLPGGLGGLFGGAAATAANPMLGTAITNPWINSKTLMPYMGG